MPLKDRVARRDYHRKYMRRRLMEDPAFRVAHLKRVARVDARRRASIREMVEAFKSNGCALCGERERCCLSAHHMDPRTKDFGISDGGRRRVTVARVRTELKKCICLCENCHRKVHAGVLAVTEAT